MGCSTSEKPPPDVAPSIMNRTPMLPRKPAAPSRGPSTFVPVCAILRPCRTLTVCHRRPGVKPLLVTSRMSSSPDPFGLSIAPSPPDVNTSVPSREAAMKTGVACGLAVAALSSLIGPAAYADDLTAEATPISLVGCIQRETEYRRQNNSGKGGFLGFGGGLGNEYVLVNASRGADGVFGDCTTATGGEAYELTGSGESDLDDFVGQRVAIAGIRKEAEVDVETGQPTGGRQAGDDLRLFEVDVESF